jgi:hypothetical protein
VSGAENPKLQGAVEKISSESWAIAGFDSTIELSESGLSGVFRFARITLLEASQVFEDVLVVCGRIELTTHNVICSEAMFTVTIPGVSRQTIPGSFKYNRITSTATIELSQVLFAGGTVRCRIIASEAGFSVRFVGSKLELGGLIELAQKFAATMSGYTATGTASMSGTFEALADAPMHLQFEAEVENASLANDAGTIAADAVVGQFGLDATFDTPIATFALTFDSDKGEAYFEPVYANFSESALHLQAEDVTTHDFIFFDVGSFQLRQASLLDASGSAKIGLPQDDSAPLALSANVELRDSSVSNLYTSLVQIEFAGSVLGDLDTDGRVSGSVAIVDSSPVWASLELEDLILDDRQGRFAIYGLQGELNWSADDKRRPAQTRLRWDSGTAYNLVISGGELDLQLGDNDVELLAPLRLATMGGALLVNEFTLQNFGDDDATGRLDAELEPIQLGQLTGAFGWPAFSGTLSGRLPLLQLADNVVTVGGTLSARAFDGSMELSNLRIEQPFGLVPQMQGDIRFRGLDLQRVTETFSFGLIQGRLSGDVVGLEMQNWRPVAMDMHFYTPVDDKSQRRISQRAVENLASVGGGGAAAVLSTGFMQFFEVFAYDRIGLRCVLLNGTCAMSGAGAAKPGPAGTGYFIVKGRGVPRIDVVGYRDTVSWARLVQQLTAITRSGSPTVN